MITPTKLIKPHAVKQKCGLSKSLKKLMIRKSAFFCFLFVTAIAISTSAVVWALERPPAEQIEQYKKDGTLAERMEFVQALGNHLASPSFVERSHYKLRKLSLQLQGQTPSEIDKLLAPPPAWEGMPTTGNVKILALLIDFPEYPHRTQRALLTRSSMGADPADIHTRAFITTTTDRLTVS